MNNERIEASLNWCKKKGIGSKQLNLFDKQFKRKKKKELSDKEFREMCEKAQVDPGSLADTVFTRSILKNLRHGGRFRW